MSTDYSMTLKKIVSGGQTGADRGALDAALAFGFPCGAWCPAERSAEDGSIPQKYPLTPLPGGEYRQRTRQSAANSFNPVLVTTPIVEIICDRGVTAAGLVRILRHVGCWFDSFRSDRGLSAVHLSRSSRRFAVAHLACLFNVRETDVAHLSSTGTAPQAGSHRRQACVSIAMGISQHVAVS